MRQRIPSERRLRRALAEAWRVRGWDTTSRANQRRRAQVARQLRALLATCGSEPTHAEAAARAIDERSVLHAEREAEKHAVFLALEGETRPD